MAATMALRIEGLNGMHKKIEETMRNGGLFLFGPDNSNSLLARSVGSEFCLFSLDNGEDQATVATLLTAERVIKRVHFFLETSLEEAKKKMAAKCMHEATQSGTQIKLISRSLGPKQCEVVLINNPLRLYTSGQTAELLELEGRMIALFN